MKLLFTCLLVGCLVSPVCAQERHWTLEEFVQKLEEAGGWPREKLETLLGVKFVDRYPGRSGAVGRFVYGKGLIVDQISYERLTDTHETLTLMIVLSKESSCFTWDRLEKWYSGADVDFNTVGVLYVYKKPWGEIVFEFIPEHVTKGGKFCLKTIETRTNKLLDLWKELYKKK